MELFIERRKQVLDMYDRYKEIIPALYDDIVSECAYSLMSKDRQVSSYGMFLPHEDMKYAVGEYKGKLTQKAEIADFTYYFDSNNRVVLTERYGLDYLFYFYKEDRVEIVWYSLRRQRLERIALLQYKDQRVVSFMQTQTLPPHVKYSNRDFAFFDYSFQYSEGELNLLLQIISMRPEGELKKRSKLEKYPYN